jgi:tetratricopeptide (TPR) repeat protein
LVVSVAAALVMVLAVLAGSVGWIVRDQAARQAKRVGDIEAALQEAEQLRREGKLPKAQAAAKRAETLLQDGGAAPALAEQVRRLLDELAEEEADGQLVALLARLRLRQADVNVHKSEFLVQRARPDYQEAFRSYGLPWERMTPAEAAAKLRSRPAPVRATAVAALDHWLILARHAKSAETDWLERVLAAADPDRWRQRLRAARTANDRQALEQLAQEVEPASQPPEALYVLHRALWQRGATAASVALLRRAQHVYPADFWVNHSLGIALQECRPPQYEEAIRFLTVAAALRSDSPGVYLNLGLALWRINRLDEAAAAFQKARALDDHYAAAHMDLGMVLLAQGRLDEAITACRRAIALKPQVAQAHYILGNALTTRGRLAEATAAYRRAIHLQPDAAEAYWSLASALRRQGELGQALAVYEQGHARGIRRASWPYPLARWVPISRRLVELEDQLPAILRGQTRPASAAERSEFAELCRAKQHYLAAARFWAEAFTADPQLAADLAAGRRDDAARAAALAAAGQGIDAGRLQSKDRSRWRKQALQWLRDDLTALAKRLKSGQPQDRFLVRQRVREWKCEQELASLRDPVAVARLPADEQQACRQFWAEVEALVNAIDSGQ